MQLNIDSSIVDQMAEGVIVLNFKADVLRHNAAAKSWLPACQAARQTIRRLIVEAITGQISLPISADFLMDAEPSVAAGTKAWLSKNGPTEYLLIVSAPRLAESVAETPTRSDVAGHHYMTLLSDQVREKFEELQLVAEFIEMPPVMRELTTQVDSLVKEMGDLSMLLQRDEVFAAERIDLNDLIQASLHQLAVQGGRLGRDALETDFAQLGAIYGNTRWLAYALEVLFHGLVRGMAPSTHLQISTRQVGDFVVLSGRDVPGTATQAAVTEVGVTASDRVVSASRDPIRLSTRMLMAQRILELHSGHLKITFLPLEVSPDQELAAPIESFSVTLLTGLPLHERRRASCAQCPLTLQAQAYAQDMAALLETRD